MNTTPSLTDSNRAIIEKVNQTFPESDMDTFISYCADDITWTMIGYPVMEGKEVIREAMEMQEYADKQFQTDQVIADGDTVAVTGSMQMRKVSTGEILRSAYCDIYRLRNGKIYQMTSYVVDLGD